jgi:hypothetical protein
MLWPVDILVGEVSRLEEERGSAVSQRLQKVSHRDAEDPADAPDDTGE